MTTMAFITHCLKKNRLDLIGLLACISLLWCLPGLALAEAAPTEISLLKLERAGDAVLLTATVKFDLPPVVEDALQKGVALFFVAEADILLERWYWSHKKVVSAERHMRLAYQPLTRRWRLNVASGLITNAGLGMALNQNFDTLHDALAAIQRLSRWHIADTTDLNLDKRHLIDFRFRLDVLQLPRPLQIGTLGQTDWDISAATRRPLDLESFK
jgi:hypothetical protein